MDQTLKEIKDLQAKTLGNVAKFREMHKAYVQKVIQFQNILLKYNKNRDILMNKVLGQDGGKRNREQHQAYKEKRQAEAERERREEERNLNADDIEGNLNYFIKSIQGFSWVEAEARLSNIRIKKDRRWHDSDDEDSDDEEEYRPLSRWGDDE